MPGQKLFTVVSIAASLVAGGCATERGPYRPPVDTGYRVQIDSGYDALPNDSSLYFQQGRRVVENELDRWTPYCRLHLLNRVYGPDYLTAVEPGVFDISRVDLRYRSSDYPYYGVQAGDTLIGFGLVGDRDEPDYSRDRGGPSSYYVYQVEMKLASADQPDVQTLACARKSGTRGGNYPTLLQIQDALGELIRIGAAES